MFSHFTYTGLVHTIYFTSSWNQPVQSSEGKVCCSWKAWRDLNILLTSNPGVSSNPVWLYTCLCYNLLDLFKQIVNYAEWIGWHIQVTFTGQKYRYACDWSIHIVSYFYRSEVPLCPWLVHTHREEWMAVWIYRERFLSGWEDV